VPTKTGKPPFNTPALNELHRSRQVVTGTPYGVAPCLPPMPDPALLQLALAPADQLDLGLALIDGICRPAYATALDDNHRQWCNRLAKALPLDMVQPDNDPLQLLRAWGHAGHLAAHPVALCAPAHFGSGRKSPVARRLP
jgi:hypothetical protein